MENTLQIFENSEFCAVRSMLIEGEPWFIGKDVATALGYTNPKKALADHVDDEDKMQGDGVTIRDPMGREQHPTIINEAGLYALIFGSELPSAKSFKRWVTHEVLPSVRKTGAYKPAPKTARRHKTARLRKALPSKRDKLTNDCARLYLTMKNKLSAEEYRQKLWEVCEHAPELFNREWRLYRDAFGERHGL